ncbi:MAG TPA: NAD-binding protein [Tepidisphaeraceae bacterium]|jgi:voltage-gated potassium channel Kch|nr:NAD-binding protein [Tepidisphaeraceae bacterium]
MEPCPLKNHAIIAGYGVPGRAAAEAYKNAGTAYCVIELNPATVDRCGHTGTPIIEGDVTDEATLRQAGAESADVLLLLVPNEKAVLAAIPIARRLNPNLKIVARCNYTSSGLEAQRRGANETIVAEQTVALEVLRLLEAHVV